MKKGGINNFVLALLILGLFFSNLVFVSIPRKVQAAGTRTVSPAGGNWSENATWVEGSPPDETMDIVINAASGDSTVDAVFNGTITSLDITAGASTSTLALGRDLTISGDLTVNATTAPIRQLIASNVLGTARTLSASNVNLHTVDFRDITFAGGMAPTWDHMFQPPEADDIYSLYEFNGYLYAGTGAYAEIYRSLNGEDWSLVHDPPGDWVRSMMEFDGFLYASTQGDAGDNSGTVYRTANGTDWVESFDVADIFAVQVLYPFGDYLYAGVSSDSGVGSLYRTSNGTNWELAYSFPDSYVGALATFGSYLYAGTGTNDGILYRSLNGTVWEAVYDSLGIAISALSVFNGYLYTGSGFDTHIYRSSDGTTWETVYSPDEQIITTFASFNGYLYAGTWDRVFFRSVNGTDWEELPTPDNSTIWFFGAFKNNLYSAVTNDPGDAGDIYKLALDSIGDAGGNSGVNWESMTSEATTQTWDGSTGNWSDTEHWASRVPLPQDTVVLAGTNTVTADMARLGKDFSFSAATPLTLDNNVSSYGSVDFTGAGNFTAAENVWDFQSQPRAGTLDFTSDSQALKINVSTYNTSLEFQDDIALSGTGSIWTHSAGTIAAGGNTINITDTSGSAKTFAGGGQTYGNLSIAGGGAGAVILTGSNTFNDFTVNAPKTVTFPSTVTTYINGVFTALGSAGNLITFNASTPGSAAILNKAGGTVSGDYLSIQDSTAEGGAVWQAGSHSASVSGNSGWVFSSPVTHGSRKDNEEETVEEEAIETLVDVEVTEIPTVEDVIEDIVYTVSNRTQETENQEPVQEKPALSTIINMTSYGTDLFVEGTAAPNATVYLTFHSNPYRAQTSADKKGKWSYLLQNAAEVLGEGDHTIFVTSSVKAADGKELQSEQSKTYDFKLSVDNGQLQVEMRKTRLWQWVVVGLAGLLIVFIVYTMLFKRIRRSSVI